MGSGYVRIIGKWQQPWKIKTSTPSSFASVHQLRNIRNSEISRPINLLSSRSFSSSSSRSSKIGFLGWYLGMLETSPLITKSVTSSLIFAAADLTSQVNPRISFLFNIFGDFISMFSVFFFFYWKLMQNYKIVHNFMLYCIPIEAIRRKEKKLFHRMGI